MLFGFIYVADFWRVAPMPSAVYPGVQIVWPITATQQLIWVKRLPGIFRPELIAGGFITMSALYLACDFLRFPLSIIGVAVGAGVPPPIVVTTVIGAVIGKLIARRLGREW